MNAIFVGHSRCSLMHHHIDPCAERQAALGKATANQTQKKKQLK